MEEIIKIVQLKWTGSELLSEDGLQLPGHTPPIKARSGEVAAHPPISR